MKKLPVKKIMSREVISVKEDMSVTSLVDLFVKSEITGAPVVNDEGKVVGVVSLSDVAHNCLQKGNIIHEEGKWGFYADTWQEQLDSEEIDKFHCDIADETCVKDIMSDVLIKIEEETPVVKAASTMFRSQIHRLIVERDSEIAGIVTTTDILKLVAQYGVQLA